MEYFGHCEPGPTKAKCVALCEHYGLEGIPGKSNIINCIFNGEGQNFLVFLNIYFLFCPNPDYTANNDHSRLITLGDTRCTVLSNISTLLTNEL